MAELLVALSANYRDVQEVAELLHKCDWIITSNSPNINQIREQFGEDKVLLIGDGMQTTYNNVRRLFPADTKFITGGNLYNLKRASEAK